MTDTAKHFRIPGRVQGVGFRAWAKGRAVGLGLSGWVRNEADGSVAGLIAGTEADVAEMISALQRGPRWAKVEEVAVEDADVPEAAGFAVLP